MVDEATWEDKIAMKSQFPTFCLEDKTIFSGGSIDRSRTQEEGPNEALAHHHSTVGPKVWYVYSRRKKNVANPNDSQSQADVESRDWLNARDTHVFPQ